MVLKNNTARDLRDCFKNRHHEFLDAIYKIGKYRNGRQLKQSSK